MMKVGYKWGSHAFHAAVDGLVVPSCSVCRGEEIIFIFSTLYQVLS